MSDIRTLDNFKKQFQYTNKDKIIEMLYDQGMILLNLEREIYNNLDKYSELLPLLQPFKNEEEDY